MSLYQLIMRHTLLDLLICGIFNTFRETRRSDDGGEIPRPCERKRALHRLGLRCLGGHCVGALRWWDLCAHCDDG